MNCWLKARSLSETPPDAPSFEQLHDFKNLSQSLLSCHPLSLLPPYVSYARHGQQTLPQGSTALSQKRMFRACQPSLVKPWWASHLPFGGLWRFPLSRYVKELSHSRSSRKTLRLISGDTTRKSLKAAVHETTKQTKCTVNLFPDMVRDASASPIASVAHATKLRLDKAE